MHQNPVFSGPHCGAYDAPQTTQLGGEQDIPPPYAVPLHLGALLEPLHPLLGLQYKFLAMLLRASC